MTVNTVISRPPFWFRMPVTFGNAIQIAGLLIGALLLHTAAHNVSSVPIQVILMIIGWIGIYLCCHAIAHYVVGWLGGIRFSGYGIRGTDDPEHYPFGMRQIMSVIPFFTAIIDKTSLAKVGRTAKALMFAAGQTSTSVCEIAAGWYAWRAGLPGGAILLVFSIIWALAAIVAIMLSPKGDYPRAIKAMRGGNP